MIQALGTTPANAFIQLVTAARHNVEEGVVEVPEEMIQELKSFEGQDKEPSIFFKKGQFWRVENGKWIPLKLSPREAKLVQMLQMREAVPLEELQREIFGENCPEELLEFSQKLKDFKYSLKENEQARLLAEQQKNDLVVYLAHDLKTPLTSVVGYLTLLEEAPELPAEQRAKSIGIALDKAYRLEQLINEFFDITRMNYQTLPAYKSPVNLTILLVKIINEVFPMMEEKNITVRQEIEPELVLSADADKMARVFDNLFRNAVNYSHAGTEIVCNARKGNGCILVSIKNRVDHIPQEKRNHIFDKFYRLDSSRQSSTGGAGLGLAIAKQIVELHDGTIEAMCNDGVMEFRIVLPV